MISTQLWAVKGKQNTAVPSNIGYAAKQQNKYFHKVSLLSVSQEAIYWSSCEKDKDM